MSKFFKRLTAPGRFLFRQIGKLLTPKVGVPETVQQRRLFGADVKANTARLGEPKPVILGRATRWPDLVAESYTFYLNNDQYFAGYYHVSVGELAVEFVGIDDLPLDQFPGARYEILPPGTAVTLVHPNVYTSPNVDGIELLGGAQSILTVQATVTIQNDGIVRTTSDVFDNARVGGTLAITGNPAYNGSYTITDSGELGAGRYGTYVVLSPAPTPASNVTLTFEFPTYAGDKVALLVEDDDVQLIAAPPTLKLDSGFAERFLVNDRITVLDSNLNRGRTFVVTGTNHDDLLYLDTAPTAETLTKASVQLLSRQSLEVFGAPRFETTVESEIDIEFERGLGLQRKNGDIDPYTVRLLVEWRPVDDADQPLADWTGVELSFTDDVISEARRFSRRITYPAAIRPQLRIRRLTSDAQGKRGNIFSATSWTGLKSFLEPRPGDEFGVSADSTRLAVLIRASGLLGAQQQRSVKVTAQSKVPTWSAGGGFSAPVATSNPYWLALWFLLRFGKGRVTAALFDLPAFAARAAAADAAMSEFNGVVDGDGLLFDLAQSVVRIDRAYLYRDPLTRLVTPGRDEQKAPTGLFADGANCAVGDLAVRLLTTDDPTGTRVKFMDLATWSLRDDGPVVGGTARIEEVELFGGTQWDQAYREAQYRDRVRRYRGVSLSIDTEMDGLLPFLQATVLVATPRYGWGSGGEVVAVSGSTLTLSQAPAWVTGATHFLYLQGDDGLPTAAIPCTRGADDQQAVLGSAPGIPLRTGAGRRTRYAFGRLPFGALPGDAPQPCLVDEIGAGGRYEATLQLTLDDARVYAPVGVIPPDPRAPAGAAPELVIDNLVLGVSP